MRRGLAAATAAVISAAASSVPAKAQEDAAAFYRGKTISLVIASAAGGGFDTYGRLVARFLGTHVPGQPRVVAQNMPGAAGAIATMHVTSIAPADGTVLGAIHPGNIIEPILGDKRKVHYDPARFQYVGNANSDVYVCIVRRDAPAKTFAEAMTREMTMGTAGEAASTRDFPLMLNNVLGTKFKIVMGYAGNSAVQLAIERGEIDGECGAGWSSVAAAHPDWFKTGSVRVLVQEASVGHPDLDRAGVPKAVDFAKTDAQRQVLDLVYSQERFGRPYIMAPDVPAGRVAAMRHAFDETFRDPAFLAEARTMGLDVSPTGGAEVQAQVRAVFAAPPDIVAQARRATTPP